MKVTKEQAWRLWCPSADSENRCAGDRCMLWVELGDGLGCCGYSQEAVGRTFINHLGHGYMIACLTNRIEALEGGKPAPEMCAKPDDIKK